MAMIGKEDTQAGERTNGIVPTPPDARPVYDSEPDYSRPGLEFPQGSRVRIGQRLRAIYGDEAGDVCLAELERILRVHHAHKPAALLEEQLSRNGTPRFSERDVILITYGDLLRGPERSPLASLASFCDDYLHGAINTLHILPFFPSSSDRGFSVIDFESVDPHLGNWHDIAELEQRYRLMFDGVFNHVSSKGRWFQEFLNGNPEYADFFVSFDLPDSLTAEQLRPIFRPRTSGILSEYRSISGPKYVWTTFSRDQIDLNYRNPRVLLRVIEILLAYVRHGAALIRLDAVGYLWREPGTRCLSLEQTHQIVKLFRDILDVADPAVALVTETNVRHEENVSYFGDGSDEAQMVYNFALPPLVLHTFQTGDATVLTRWASQLDRVSDSATYFNLLDSHDGIGLLGARGILGAAEMDTLITGALEQGGRISCRSGENGEPEPYEINITWYSALSRRDDDGDVAFHVRRFVASRVIALVLRGVPGIYLHSMIGTINDIEAVLATSSNRDINRRVIDAEAIQEALREPLSKVSRIDREFGRLIALRTRLRAFHPNGHQRVLDLSPHVFAVLRISPEGDQTILCLTGVHGRTVQLEIPVACLPTSSSRWADLVGGMEWLVDGSLLRVTMEPYDILWLTPC